MNLLDFLLLSIVFQLALFIPAFIFRTDKLTDLAYGLGFFVVSLLAFRESSMGLVHYLLFGVIILWAIRLGGYLFIRINKIGKDERFDGIRDHFVRFFLFWVIQGIVIWAVLIGSITIFSVRIGDNLGFMGIFGFLISISGIFIEGVADYQKYKFKNEPKNKNKWIDSGLWNYSRHPNYFGEFLVWLGIFFVSLGVLSFDKVLISLISPVLILFILTMFSGIPALERKYDQKYGKDKKYQEYKRNTSAFLIWSKLG